MAILFVRLATESAPYAQVEATDDRPRRHVRQRGPGRAGAGRGCSPPLAAPPAAAPPPAPAKRGLSAPPRSGLAIVAVVSLLEAARVLRHVSSCTATTTCPPTTRRSTATRWTSNAPATGGAHPVDDPAGRECHANQVVGPDRDPGQRGTAASGRSSRPAAARSPSTNAVERPVRHGRHRAGHRVRLQQHLRDRRVAETDIRNVQLGKPVDISVDAFPGVPVTGVVEEIQASSAGLLSRSSEPGHRPEQPAEGDQYIPVRLRSPTPVGSR